MATTESPAPSEETEAVLATIQDRADAIARQEREQALAALEARGDVTDRHEEVLEELCDGIVEALLEPPAETIHQADDRRAVETALDLFDPAD